MARPHPMGEQWKKDPRDSDAVGGPWQLPQAGGGQQPREAGFPWRADVVSSLEVLQKSARPAGQ